MKKFAQDDRVGIKDDTDRISPAVLRGRTGKVESTDGEYVYVRFDTPVKTNPGSPALLSVGGFPSDWLEHI